MTRGVEARPAEWSWNNVEAGHIAKESREGVVQDTIQTAYFFVLNQIHSLSQWEDIRLKPYRQTGWDNERVSIQDFSSHYNAVYNYMGDCIVGGPQTLPNNPANKKLFQTTRDMYDQLDRKKIRYVFGGEEALSTDDPGRVIPEEELQTWLQDHSGREDGLVEGGNPQDTHSIETGLSLVGQLHKSGYVEKNDGWTKQWNLARFSKFPEETLQLGVYKLGCGMAIIDQLVQEATNLEQPLRADYIPSDREDAEEKYGELPTLKQLWQNAHSMLRDLGNPDDELLQHLFQLEKLEGLREESTA